MKEKNNNNNLSKRPITNEEDFNISITNEHNEQELTSMGETGKSSGLISAMNFPHFNISFTNKNKLYNNRQLEQFNQKVDNYSMYTNIKKIRSNNSFLNDEMLIEVRNLIIIYIIIFQYRKLLDILDKKENERKEILQIHNQKMINYANIKEKLRDNKEKLDIIRTKNEYMKLLICKLMKENK